MRRTRWQTLATVTAAVTVGTYLVLRLLQGQGVTPPPVPWSVVLVCVVIAGVVLRMGWAVRQFLRGRRPDLDPVRAARTVVLAKASSLTGSLLLGWYGGQALLFLGDLDVEPRRARAVAAAVAALGAAVLTVVGLVVERMCEVPPPSDEAGEEAAPDGADPAAA